MDVSTNKSPIIIDNQQNIITDGQQNIITDGQQNIITDNQQNIILIGSCTISFAGDYPISANIYSCQDKPIFYYSKSSVWPNSEGKMETITEWIIINNESYYGPVLINQQIGFFLSNIFGLLPKELIALIAEYLLYENITIDDTPSQVNKLFWDNSSSPRPSTINKLFWTNLGAGQHNFPDLTNLNPIGTVLEITGQHGEKQFNAVFSKTNEHADYINNMENKYINLIRICLYIGPNTNFVYNYSIHQMKDDLAIAGIDNITKYMKKIVYYLSIKQLNALLYIFKFKDTSKVKTDPYSMDDYSSHFLNVAQLKTLFHRSEFNHRIDFFGNTKIYSAKDSVINEIFKYG